MAGSSGGVWRSHGTRVAVARYAIVAALIVAYRLSFLSLHDVLGNLAFLVGLVPCIAAAVILGLRGALLVVVLVQVIDLDFGHSMHGPETGRTAGVIALLVKLIFAAWLGLTVDACRRIEALNARLRREVDARKQSEASLRHSEELYRALVESLGEGLGLFDAAGRVVFANPTLSCTLGVPPEELIGKRFDEYVAEASHSPSSEASPELAGARSYELSLKRDPSTLLLVTETRLARSGPQGALALRVVRDLTERLVSARRQRDLERELQRSQVLQSLAVMAGGVAHDFNNLLCGVVGNAQLVQRKLPASAPPVVRQALAEIVTLAGEAAELSRHMLAYANRHSPGIEALELHGELRAALRLLQANVAAQARLVLELADGLPEVAADRLQLRQVFTNLVLNALDAMEGKGGVLTVRTERLHLDPERAQQYLLDAGEYVKVTVEDTGPGIAAEARERLFEPFFSTKAAGRGMGLAAAAGIVRRHRGWLGIDSTSEHGTRFGVLLPVANGSTPRRTRLPEAPVARRPRRVKRASSRVPGARNILLIDDQAAVRVVTGRLLNELGHHVVTADSGQRGLELFSEDPYAIDLVVLDLTMPERPGEQILDELRVLRGDVPVVITSGFHAQDASKLLRVPNVVGFLDKPHTLSNLELVLAAVAPRAVSAGSS